MPETKQIRTIKDLDEKQRRMINAKGDGTICECGSKEFFLAPIVNIRCNECKQPLPTLKHTSNE